MAIQRFILLTPSTYSTSFANYTAWKWQLEKKNHDLAPELTAYTLTRSFSYARQQCGRDSPTPNCHIYTTIHIIYTIYSLYTYAIECATVCVIRTCCDGKAPISILSPSLRRCEWAASFSLCIISYFTDKSKIWKTPQQESICKRHWPQRTTSYNRHIA